MNTKTQTRNLCLSGVFAALVFAITRFIQIPIPFGYFNVGNSFILFFCLLLPTPYGVAVGALGSALADLLSYPVYTIPTLLIKALMPMVFYLILQKKSDKKVSRFKALFSASIGTLIPLFGYTFTGMLIAGSFYSGLAQFPGLFIEYLANLIIFQLFNEKLYPVIKKTMGI